MAVHRDLVPRDMWQAHLVLVPTQGHTWAESRKPFLAYLEDAAGQLEYKE